MLKSLRLDLLTLDLSWVTNVFREDSNALPQWFRKILAVRANESLTVKNTLVYLCGHSYRGRFDQEKCMTIRKVAVVFPCYNVEKTVAKVLGSFSSQTLDQINEIIAIDNQSQDRTLEVLRQVAASKSPVGQKLTVISNNRNYGYGGSQKIGYGLCLDSHKTHVMVIHSDDQTDANQIATDLLNELEARSNTDLVIGSRFSSDSNIKGYSKLRIFGNYFFNLLTFLMTGHRMSDSGAAIMLVKTDVLRRVNFQRLTNSWQFHPQLNILFYSLPGIQVREIPMNWKDASTGSNLNLLKYGVTLLKILVSYKIQRSILKRNPEECFIEANEASGPVIQFEFKRIT